MDTDTRHKQSLFVLGAEVVEKYASRDLAFTAVREAFIAIASKRAELFPVVIGMVVPPETKVSIKSGINHSDNLLGLKVGSYWPDNAKFGLSNHGSTTLLYHRDTGMPRALINARVLNGLRTAAANAVATDVLARSCADHLTVLGTGHQAGFEVRAVCDVRDIKQITVWGRSPVRAEDFAQSLSDVAVDNITVEKDADIAVANADIVTTATTATEPLFRSSSVKPGTHISAMGADKAGKQELPTKLLTQASLFADEPGQSLKIGEFQHLSAENSSQLNTIVPVGKVLNGDHPGRVHNEEITVFDSSGIAIQDLNVAEAILSLALEQGDALSIPF